MAKTNLPLTLTGERIEFQRLYDLLGSAGRNMTTSGAYSFTSQSSSTVYSAGSGGEYAVFLQLQTALENYDIGADDFNAKAEQSAVTAVANDLLSHLAESATLTALGHVKHGTLTTTLDTTWTGSSAPYTKTQAVAGILATDNPTVDIVMSGTYATDDARASAWANIYRITTADDSITLYAKEKPTVSLPIQLKVVR